MSTPAQQLNSPAHLAFYNQSRFLESAFYFPDQIRKSWEDSYETIIPLSVSQIKNIVFAGMGGSSLPGRLIHSLYRNLLTTPFEVISDYHLPSYVGVDSLVICCSYSGQTQESLNLMSEARQRGSQVYLIATGGEFEKLGATYNLPRYIFSPDLNLATTPRTGGGYLIGGTLGLLTKCGLISLNPDQITSAISFLKSQSGNFDSQVPFYQNPAKLLAEVLLGKIPVLVSSSHLIGSLYSFQTHLHETAKTFSVIFESPDLDHHLLDSLVNPPGNRANLVFLFFQSQLFHPEVSKSLKLAKNIINQQGFTSLSYVARSGKTLTECLEIIQLAPFVSFYLSTLVHLDPKATPWVDYFKDRMRPATY